MSEVEKYLRQMVSFRRTLGNPPKDLKYWLLHELVLAEGRFMGTRSPLSEEYPRGRKRECFKNAYELTARNLLGYCEGFAMGVIPVLHAWVVDRDGNVIDPTWADGAEYFGIEFKRDDVIRVALKTEYYGMMDNPGMRHFLLRGNKIGGRKDGV